ncbi:MAG: ATP-binding cassette domain-containing protein [Halanaerobiales bacterium]|nr:ATP-binding cassette domain-containing protein [Halanaerobiales bacterium]
MPRLKADKILRRFGGLIAVNNLSFTVGKDEILGIIGPNGAGKTTVINLIAGTLPVNKGSITFRDEDITKYPAHIRTQKGVARTFQIVRPLKDFTALENIMVGALFGKGNKLNEARKKSLEICELLKLKNVNKNVDELTVLELKKIELGRALASDPKLLFLDEIMAGLNSEETWELIEIVKGVQKTDISICVVEHIMKVVKELTDRVIVLDRGQIIAQGPYSEVSQQQNVIAAYLGEEE